MMNLFAFALHWKIHAFMGECECVVVIPSVR